MVPCAGLALGPCRLNQDAVEAAQERSPTEAIERTDATIPEWLIK